MENMEHKAAALVQTMKNAGCSDETITKALWEFALYQGKVIEREVEHRLR